MMKAEKIQKILKKGLKVTLQNKALCFLPGDRRPKKTVENTLLEKIQDVLKKYGRFYYFLIYGFSPVLPSPVWIKKRSELINAYGEDKVILNLGSGPMHIVGRTDIINVDVFAYHEVDIVADVTDLPIEDNSVDLIINTGLLEHVDEPKKVIQEMIRVLRDGGKVVCYLPFMVPFHAAPYDYYRWTILGAQKLFSEFYHIEIGIGSGPTSGMLYVLQEWLSILLSFGSKTLHDILFLALMVITAPIKMLDVLMVKLPYAEKIASGFYVIGEKRLSL